jgi:hypothetical protein
MSKPFFVKPVREASVEAEGCAYARERGWIEFKITSPSKRGFPDRFYARWGTILLVEWKKPGEGPTPQQAKRHRELRAAGVLVCVIDNMDLARAVFF